MSETQVPEVIYYSKPIAIEHHFEIGPIDCPEQFKDLFAILRESGPDDVVYLHLNTPGGCLYTTIQIRNAMLSSKATVVTCAEGAVQSGGSILFFSGDAFVVGDHCDFLIHTASGRGPHEKVNDKLVSAQATSRLLEELYEDVFGGFLSKKELREIKEGRETYLTSGQVKDRVVAYMKKQQEEQVETEN